MSKPGLVGLILGIAGALAGALVAGVFIDFDVTSWPQRIAADRQLASQAALLGWVCGSVGLVFGISRPRLSSTKRWTLSGLGVFALGLMVFP